jgi:hypothetical protein
VLTRNAFLLAIVLFLAPAFAQRPQTAVIASIFGRNLIVNGNAEAASMARWSRAGDHRGLSDRALRSRPLLRIWRPLLPLELVSGADELFSTQAINIAPAHAQIDEEGVAIKLSGYFGLVEGSTSTGFATAVYQDAAGKELGALATL